MKKQTKASKSKPWLTNFCDSLRIFVSIVMIQVIVIIYSLSFLSYDWSYVSKLSILTMMSQLIGLVILITLCKFRETFNRMRVINGMFLITIFVIVLTSTLAQVIGKLDLQLTFHLFENQVAINILNIKLSVSTVLITWSLIRYFYIQDQWQRQIQKLSEAKLNALQARIKPHFLFNSLNSIASLITIDANRAETAITNFSSLMRRTFMHQDKFISIEQELEWINQYLAIEKLRLDSRLHYKINCADALKKIKIPVLCLQPLIENAVIHGIAPLPEGGEIVVDIYRKNNTLIMHVTNPFTKSIAKQSNGMALENIKQRLELHYADKAFIIKKTDNDIFEIQIGVPV